MPLGSVADVGSRSDSGQSFDFLLSHYHECPSESQALSCQSRSFAQQGR